MATPLVTVDIGGTHARFALAEVAQGNVVHLSDPVTMKTAEHASFQTAWEAFDAMIDQPIPRAVAIAIAGPVTGEVIKFTNNPWIIRPALIKERLNVDAYTLVNDFGAVGHAVAQAEPEYFEHLCGPDTPLTDEGTISIVGPGTGLGVAHIHRHAGGYHVQATEGGHIDFAPLDAIEDAILARMRKRFRRVSIERIVSGPGLVDIYETLAAIEGRAIQQLDDKQLWALGMAGEDSLASAAIDRIVPTIEAEGIVDGVAGDRISKGRADCALDVAQCIDRAEAVRREAGREIDCNACTAAVAGIRRIADHIVSGPTIDGVSTAEALETLVAQVLGVGSRDGIGEVGAAHTLDIDQRVEVVEPVRCDSGVEVDGCALGDAGVIVGSPVAVAA